MYVWPKWHETHCLGLFWHGNWARDASDVSQAPSHPCPRRPPPYHPPPRSLSPPLSSVWDVSRWWCTCLCLDGGGCDVAVRCVVLVKITINRKNRKKKKNIPRAQETHWQCISWALFVLLGPWGSGSGPKRCVDDVSLGTFFHVVCHGDGSGGGGCLFAIRLWLWLTYM